MSVFHMVFALVRSLVRDRVELAAENLALRQQLAVLRENAKRPSLRQRDRVLSTLVELGCGDESSGVNSRWPVSSGQGVGEIVR